MARILVCEDSPSQALNLRMILEKAGHEVVLAQDGQMGLGILQTSAFDLVMSDVQMPNLGGFDLCRKIRQEAQLVTLPVILMTTLREMQDMRRGQDVGANMYVVKPFEAADLLRRIGRFLPSTDAATASPAAAAAAPAAATPPLTGIAAIRVFLTKIVDDSKKGLDSKPDDALRELLDSIHKSAEEALTLCGSQPATKAKGPTQGTLVLVQPNESLKRVLQTNLEQQGWNVLGVVSAEEAVHECRRLGKAIDILVIEALALASDLIVKVRESNRDLKVVCMANADDIVDFDAVSVTLRRPFTLHTLVNTLDQLQNPSKVPPPAPAPAPEPKPGRWSDGPPAPAAEAKAEGPAPPETDGAIPQAAVDALEKALEAAAHSSESAVPPPRPRLLVPPRPAPRQTEPAPPPPPAYAQSAAGYDQQAPQYGQDAYGYAPQDPNAYPQQEGYPPQGYAAPGYPPAYGYAQQEGYPAAEGTDPQGYPPQGYGYPPQYGQEYAYPQAEGTEGYPAQDGTYPEGYEQQQVAYPYPAGYPQEGQEAYAPPYDAYPQGYPPQGYEGYPEGYPEGYAPPEGDDAAAYAPAEAEGAPESETAPAESPVVAEAVVVSATEVPRSAEAEPPNDDASADPKQGSK